MGRKRSNQSSLLLWATVAALLSQTLIIPVISSATFEEQKHYYHHDPNVGTPPTGSSGHSPSHGSGGGHGSTTPSHGTPSHGGNCGNPPSGGHATPTPSTPSGGGGYSHTPSTPTPIVNPPTIVSPPTTPISTPATPTVPSPPYAFDPNSPPFTCNYWRTHPTLIWGVLGWWGTVGGTLGATSIPGFGSSMSVLQALSNTHTDGFGALYREGTASFLNSMVYRDFPYTTTQVRDRFVGALSSNKAAANQAQLFKLANEGRVKLRA